MIMHDKKIKNKKTIGEREIWESLVVTCDVRAVEIIE
jgi:hypothetical protein